MTQVLLLFGLYNSHGWVWREQDQDPGALSIISARQVSPRSQWLLPFSSVHQLTFSTSAQLQYLIHAKLDTSIQAKVTKDVLRTGLPFSRLQLNPVLVNVSRSHLDYSLDSQVEIYGVFYDCCYAGYQN